MAIAWFWQEGLLTARADNAHSDISTAEGWVWAKLGKGQLADLDERCSSDTTARDFKADDPRWNDPCRTLSATFLRDFALNESGASSSLPSQGVRIRGAHVAHDPTTGAGLDFENASIKRAVDIRLSLFDDSIVLRHAQTDSVISIDASWVNGDVDAAAFRARSGLSLAGTHVAKLFDVSGARVEGDLDLYQRALIRTHGPSRAV